MLYHQRILSVFAAVVALFSSKAAASAGKDIIAYIGTFTWLSTISGDEIYNPTWLSISSDRRVLYSVREESQASLVHSYAISERSPEELIYLNTVNLKGATPNHMSLDEDTEVIVVSNYCSGSTDVISINSDGALGIVLQTIQRNDPVNTTNCDGAKAHESVLTPVDRRAYVMDLGSNCIYQYDYGKSSVGEYLMVPSNIDPIVIMPPGCGPRHMLIHPSLNRAYLVCELSSTVTVLTVDPTTRALFPVYTISTLRPGENSTDMAAGELQLSLDGKFLYVSNRDNSDPNQNRSSIAVFSLSVDNQELIHIQNVDSHGMHPRHFTLDFTGTVLLVANLKSNNIVSFSVDIVTGLIDENSAKIFQHPDLVGPAQILLVPFLIK